MRERHAPCVNKNRSGLCGRSTMKEECPRSRRSPWQNEQYGEEAKPGQLARMRKRSRSAPRSARRAPVRNSLGLPPPSAYEAAFARQQMRKGMRGYRWLTASVVLALCAALGAALGAARALAGPTVAGARPSPDVVPLAKLPATVRDDIRAVIERPTIPAQGPA